MFVNGWWLGEEDRGYPIQFFVVAPKMKTGGQMEVVYDNTQGMDCRSIGAYLGVFHSMIEKKDKEKGKAKQ